MVRAGVFVGVDNTGGLQKLNDAAAGAERMYNWAIAQGFTTPDNATLITDRGGKVVRPDAIYDAIAAVVNGPGVDQLMVYFAGHGVNINRGEQWLLTEAPVRTSAAVNVVGSVELARYCGIQHVVLISDACRVAAEGIQAQNVRGQDIFPNDGAGDRAKPVDQFFACFLGRTAAELKDPTSAAANYTALYTNALLDALDGLHVDILERSTDAGDAAYYVRPRKLESFLEREVPRRVKEMQLEGKVNQNPDAIITSDDTWLSRIEGAVPLAAGRRGHGPPAAPATMRSVSADLVRSAVGGNTTQFERRLEIVRTAGFPGGADLAFGVDRVATPFGPDHFETECGIKVRGSRILEFVAPRVTAQILSADGTLLRVSSLDAPAASVLLRFPGEIGAVIPVLPGFLTGLTFEDDELVDVTYEPSQNSWRWSEYKNRATDVRALRAVAASSSRQGRFRLERDDAATVAQKMQYSKGIDPTLAVYAAYAYHDLQAIDRIRQMSAYLQADVGATFFDLALLGRTLVGKEVTPADRIVPFVPMLAQGWALLSANRVKLTAKLEGIGRTVRDSLWTLFDARGVEQIKDSMLSGAVR